MGKFSTLSIGVSGLMAAQTGLYVTGHNMANVDTVGFTRQQALQHDFRSVTVGRNGIGILQTGLGTDISCIRQIRNHFLDISYRDEAGKYDFYLVKGNAGMEMETIVGELQSQYSTDSVIKDMFNSLQELSFDPSSLSSRGTFILTAITFVDKVSNVYNRILEYQYNLDAQVRAVVQEINTLANDIERYNRLIMDAEMAGDRANDYRDARGVCLDQLSHLLSIEYKERPNGRVDVHAEGKELVINGVVKQLGLRYCGPNNSFVEPVFTDRTDVLGLNEDAVTLFDYSRNVKAANGNDYGRLKSLIVTRGLYLTTYAGPVGNAASLDATKIAFNERCFIPKVMQEFDNLIHTVVTMINDAVAPRELNYDSPVNLYYSSIDGDDSDTWKYRGIEIFVRKYTDRYEYGDDRYPLKGADYNEEDPENYFSLYSAGNLMINPRLLESGGYNLIALMTVLPDDDDPDNENPNAPGGLTDNTLVLNELLAKWKGRTVQFGDGESMSVDDAYRQFIANLGIETSEALTFVDEQATLLVQLDNKRDAIAGVSLDEEMRNMMIYQHAYNAAARIVNVVDSMIDKIVNGTGRVGL
jgi:flagellar hook-associated protein 1 FlgK